jgi:hypothetical protein
MLPQSAKVKGVMNRRDAIKAIVRKILLVLMEALLFQYMKMI